MLRILPVAALFLCISANARAAATFLSDARCVDNVAHVHEGIGEVPPSTCGVTSFPITGFTPSGTATADSLAFASAGPSGLRVSAYHTVYVAGAKSGSRGNSSQTYAEWNFDDFVVSGPGSAPVPASLHLFVSGLMSAFGSTDGQGSLTSLASGGGDFNMKFVINGAFAGLGSASYGFSNGTIQETSEGALAGHVHGGSVSDIITSNQLMLPIGVYSVHVEVSANANGLVRILGTPADEFDSVMASGGGYSNFQSTVTFPTSGPVFDLPPGYTVNSVSAGIVNNQLVPEPSSALLLLAAGAGGLCGTRRRLSGARPRN